MAENDPADTVMASATSAELDGAAKRSNDGEVQTGQSTDEANGPASKRVKTAHEDGPVQDKRRGMAPIKAEWVCLIPRSRITLLTKPGISYPSRG
jgi:hypothetical protein